VLAALGRRKLLSCYGCCTCHLLWRALGRGARTLCRCPCLVASADAFAAMPVTAHRRCCAPLPLAQGPKTEPLSYECEPVVRLAEPGDLLTEFEQELAGFSLASVAKKVESGLSMPVSALITAQLWSTW
jgi:hypothetical protein